MFQILYRLIEAGHYLIFREYTTMQLFLRKNNRNKTEINNNNKTTLFVEIFALTNFRALALRENRKFSREFIFEHLQILSFQKPMAIQTKNRGRFCENSSRIYFRAQK